MTTRVAFILAFTLIANQAMADEPETKRDVIVAKHDADGNKRLDGKEMKNFKSGNPKMYDSLLTFCEAANEHPKKMGVDLPADPDKKQLQCKKKHVSRRTTSGGRTFAMKSIGFLEMNAAYVLGPACASTEKTVDKPPSSSRGFRPDS